MDYFDLYHCLRDRVTTDVDTIDLGGGVRLFNLEFRSVHDRILPGEDTYACPVHGAETFGTGEFADPRGVVEGILDLRDSRVRENREFRYPVFHPRGDGRARDALLFFHGFNEKYWHKYLPWAYRLAERTGRTVILFPIAFHMNRAPLAWIDRRLMHRASEQRKHEFPAVIGSSLSNAAISIRLQAKPQRFCWSGLQTYHDAVRLLEDIRAGEHPLVEPGAVVDLFGYSIGCLLSQVLLMTDPAGILSDARLCCFCGGAVFNRMSPVSRFILDSEANVALYSCLVEHLDSHLRDDARLRHHLGEAHPEGVNFRSMLSYNVMRKEREAHFRRLGPRLLAVALEQDTVIPPWEVRNTLQGSDRDLPAGVETLDFPYPCRHEDPFPVVEPLRAPVDEAFRGVFDLVADFYAR
ncbi:MAG: hypothetical protein KA419_03480 [Acidobacteria bacterium]|nr:hypothetical protein [Acidobacteriota bacterium]